MLYYNVINVINFSTKVIYDTITNTSSNFEVELLQSAAARATSLIEVSAVLFFSSKSQRDPIPTLGNTMAIRSTFMLFPLSK